MMLQVYDQQASRPKMNYNTKLYVDLKQINFKSKVNIRQPKRRPVIMLNQKISFA